MASGNIKHYLGCGPAADRPAALELSPGALGIYHASDTDELWLWVDNERWESRGTGGDGIPDAPSDGKLYGRKDGGWEEVPSTTGGGDAASVTFDPSATGIAAGNVQDAIDEIFGDVDSALAAIIGVGP